MPILFGMPAFGPSKSMKCEWLKSLVNNLCSGFCLYDYIYSKGGVKGIFGSTVKLKMVPLRVQGHGLLQM